MAPPPSKKTRTAPSAEAGPSTFNKKTKKSKKVQDGVERVPVQDFKPEKELGLDDLEDSDDDLDGEDEDEFDVEGASDNDEEGGVDTDEEIANPKVEKSKKTAKRKRRATSPETFGNLLTSLLDPAAASTSIGSSKPNKKPETASNILSLAPSIKKTISARQLEARARKVLAVNKAEKEDKGRIRDVIGGGWSVREVDGIEIGGGEWERGLRKIAQRGVVKLFNTILQTSSTNSAEVAAIPKGEGRTQLPAPEPLADPKRKPGKDNILGRAGKEGGGVSKEDFERMIRGE